MFNYGIAIHGGAGTILKSEMTDENQNQELPGDPSLPTSSEELLELIKESKGDLCEQRRELSVFGTFSYCMPRKEEEQEIFATRR